MKEYKLIIDGHRCELRHLDGSEIDFRERMATEIVIRETYQPRSYIYLLSGCSLPGYEGLYKIGVSKHVHHRARSLSAWPIHWVSCGIDWVWKLEKALHEAAKKWRVKGEWFDLRTDEKAHQFYKRFLECRTEGPLIELAYEYAGWMWSDLRHYGQTRP